MPAVKRVLILGTGETLSGVDSENCTLLGHGTESLLFNV